MPRNKPYKSPKCITQPVVFSGLPCAKRRLPEAFPGQSEAQDEGESVGRRENGHSSKQASSKQTVSTNWAKLEAKWVSTPLSSIRYFSFLCWQLCVSSRSRFAPAPVGTIFARHCNARVSTALNKKPKLVRKGLVIFICLMRFLTDVP